MNAWENASLIRTDRLEELAQHLMTGTLWHDRFDFTKFSCTKKCETVGCARGEACYLWPDEYPNTGAYSQMFASMPFFGVYCRQDLHLFYAGSQEVDLYGGKVLGPEATRYEVAANIFAFVRLAIENGARSPNQWETEVGE